jgi:glycosyltransferase involved in cell wall biosynthesis
MLGRVAKADLLVVLTKGDASDWRIYTKKILVIPNPVTNYPKSVLPHDGSGHRILCVGRLHEQKGFDLLIDAFAMIAHQCPEWKIDIFGEGSDKEFLEVKIRNVNLDSRIVINRPTDNIYNEYQHSEFFVLSSRYEGFALVMAEAMSCGIPCVAFKCKYGPEEVIDDGDNGVLVENGNVEELAQKILWMINHVEERLRMGENARVVMRQYELNSIMSNWLSLFEHISPKLAV